MASGGDQEGAAAGGDVQKLPEEAEDEHRVVDADDGQRPKQTDEAKSKSCAADTDIQRQPEPAKSASSAAAGLPKFSPPARVEEASTTENSEGIAWSDIRRKLLRGNNSAEEHFIGLFEREYDVSSPVEALVNIKSFMGVFLVQEFEYESFCMSVGTVTAKLMEKEDAWKNHISKHLVNDLTIAITLMMRLASIIARAYDLQDTDWKDINLACGKAVRAVPACYKLQRELPGALNDARALRYLPIPTTDLDGGQDLNPWRSAEGKVLFEDAHETQWDVIEALSRQDTEPKYCFACRCAVEEVTVAADLASIYLRVVDVGEREPPGGKPPKDVQRGDPVLWEVDAKFASLVQRGFIIEGDWYEMQNEVCFMSSLTCVGPGW